MELLCVSLGGEVPREVGLDLLPEHRGYLAADVVEQGPIIVTLQRAVKSSHYSGMLLNHLLF